MADFFTTHSPPGPASSPATAAEKKAHKDQPRIRRRNRLITSCLECRRRKLKCDKLQPCTNCTKFSRDCVFLAPALDPAGQAKLAEVKEKMGLLEKTLEEDVARRRSSSKSTSASAATSLLLPGQDGSHSDYEELEDERGLEPTPLATEDAAYYEDADDDLVDLGIQLGKMRITERVGGFVRPRLSEELAQALKEVPPKEENPLSIHAQDSYLAPGRDYVAPSSSFFFAPGIQKTSLMTYLPSKVLADKLIEHYWRAVHVVSRTLHRPSFEQQYENFWRDISTGVEPRVSFQAVVLAALLASIISMPEKRVLSELGVAKESLVENFKQGTEATLARANFLRTTKFETLQAFVMYLIPLCRAEVSRAHSALTGTAIRLAECMGLHRDPSLYSLSPVDVHLRRLIWYQICFLDLRTCEATGPRPQIRRQDFDTKFPLNIDDVDLGHGWNVQEDAKHFTDMTITRMRFECYEMHRLIWAERPRIEKKKTTLTSLLSKIQVFQAAMEKTYLPMLDKRIPLHFLATQIYGILSCRMHVMVLNKYASNQHRLMPERLRQIMIGSSVLILEHSITMETTPALSIWTWYVGALHQYHTALLLLSELYAKARDPAVEARVWRCLDYAFELPAGLDNAEKSRKVLEDLIGRTEMYQSIRRVRAPTNMKPAGPRMWNFSSQHEQEERERRSSSTQLSLTPYTVSSSGPAPALHISHSNIPGQVTPQIPDLDYSSFPAMSAASGPGRGMTGPDSHAYGAFASVTNASGGLMSTGMSPPHHDSDTSSVNMAGGGGQGSNNGASPIEGMPDIDWNEWDRLFPPAEMTGDIIIPPFTFPQFSPTDLQWGSEMQ
ncbi:hypothetical protein K469DRAFT_724950 [Zopfia rhizophila CBS 207.26]|uniref:Zn(2)-C6 fungal-type domain-containing protein n=1 Tax=Zopfia rhizophila CBS 207.26 TaxID=1314779 RepID=A0A6A6D633_9PEZI|nr:hypothetical protein K469DRAFT_724950 [Zopfia rhizophila CBS 207.26]